MVHSNSFAFGNSPDGCQFCFNGEDYENYSLGVKKVNVGSTLRFDLTNNISFNSDFKYLRSDVVQQFQPSFRFGSINVDVEDNAFLDAGLRQTLLDVGQTNAGMAKFLNSLVTAL
ncbi:hypothetical protein [Colwellia sp. MB02u-6]|jgi:hypothetical protein|uniref:hypothetical protein n=1 Tax=Colwellia sp. MB02u-6 TaxID=2759824 RepID=UPI002175306C|nr:hypothetical protein [Colwellia sp. MB02u-6]